MIFNLMLKEGQHTLAQAGNDAISRVEYGENEVQLISVTRAVGRRTPHSQKQSKTTFQVHFPGHHLCRYRRM